MLARPANAFIAEAAASARHRPRLAIAAIAAVTLHLVLLAFRPVAMASSYVAPPPSPVMAVRVVRPPAAAQPGAAVAEPIPTTPAPVAPVPLFSARQAPSERKLFAVNEVRSAPKPSPAPAAATAARPDDGRPSETASVSDPQDASVPLAAAPDYALGVRLDPGPRPLDEIEPEYPDPVHLREGTVVLRLLISDTGHVDDVAVVRAEPRGVFEQAALDAFAKARFSPGLAAGTPVKSQIMVEVQFMPINRGARVSGRTY